MERHAIRLALLPVGVILAFLAYDQNVVTGNSERIIDVSLTGSGTVAWVLAILVWFGVLAVDLNALGFRLYERLAGRRTAQQKQTAGQSRLMAWRPQWQHGALLAVMLVAMFFRFNDLSGVPPEMTSDHIEKLFDAVRVFEGYDGIFFPNNGGREGFQMHFIAGLVRYAGQDFSFDTLKLASIIEGLLTVFAGYWLGITMMGRETAEQRQMGVWLGISFAALLAVSSWHTMLSRLGLRIALTPLTTVLVLIFLIRGMRHNRRLDFVILGFILGVGTYFYQANRMLPLLVLVGVALAVAVYSRRWRDVGVYGMNLLAAGLMAFVVFIPLYRYSTAFPEDFWNRTRGRLFGEQAFIRDNPETGIPETYDPNLSEQFDRFLNNFDAFEQNYVDALRMWSWQGDGAWINNGGGRPALDPFTNALFLLGLVAWAGLIFKRWDMAHVLVPLGIMVMLLPSALTLAYQIENPSFTRASGTIPLVFIIAGYPLAQLGYYISNAMPRRRVGTGLALLLMIPIIALAGRVNYETFFEVYRESYSTSWKPYTAMSQPMQAFAQGEGSYGNAFLIAYPHWLDHRILGTSAGDIRWNNGLANRQDLFAFIDNNAGTPYQYDSSKPLFFMYNSLDVETSDWLRTLFRDGEERLAVVEENPSLNFLVFTAPPNQDWQGLRAINENYIAATSE